MPPKSQTTNTRTVQRSAASGNTFRSSLINFDPCHCPMGGPASPCWMHRYRHTAPWIPFPYGANCWRVWHVNPAHHTTTYTCTWGARKTDKQTDGKEVHRAPLSSSNIITNPLLKFYASQYIQLPQKCKLSQLKWLLGGIRSQLHSIREWMPKLFTFILLLCFENEIGIY